MFDDGVSLLDESKIWHLEMHFANDKLSFNILKGENFDYQAKNGLVGEITVYGGIKQLSEVIVTFNTGKLPATVPFY